MRRFAPPTKPDSSLSDRASTSPSWYRPSATARRRTRRANQCLSQTLMPGHGWPAPVVMMFAASGADPALPVGGANFREPQDAASESMSQRDRRGHGVVVLPHAADLALAEAVDAD